MKFVVSFLGLLAFVAAYAQELPTAPEGFSWERLPELKSALLKPKSWHVRREERGTTVGYFISKEPITEHGGFTTGLTFQCIRKVDRAIGVPASAYIAQFADAAAEKRKFDERRSFRMGPFDAVRFRYISAPANEASVTIVNLLIANDKTGTVFVVIFEAPTETWVSDYKVGEVILKKMLLDDEI